MDSKTSVWLTGCLGAAVLLAGCAADGDRRTVEGAYFCAEIVEDGLGGPCADGSAALVLSKDGAWQWYDESGDHRLKGGQVVFTGDSARTLGPAVWGDAELDGRAIVFTGGDVVQVWLPELGDPAAMAATAAPYVCEGTDVFGPVEPCSDRETLLVLEKDGTWDFGSYTGRWSVEGDRIYFRSSTAQDGPPTWGTAVVHEDSLSFHGALNDHTTLWVRAERPGGA